MRIANVTESTITLEFDMESKDLVLRILKEELEKCKNKLVHLNRKKNDERENGETTWWSGGCKIQAERAANLMYDTMEQWATLESMIKQLEEVKE